MTVEFRIENNRIPAIIARHPQVSQEALDEVGEFVRKWAHDRCAVKGGTSVDGVYVSRWDASSEGRSGAVRASIKKNLRQGEVRVGSNHILAPKLELGEGLNPPLSVTAKPFLRPAIDENRREIVDRYWNRFWAGVRGS